MKRIIKRLPIEPLESWKQHEEPQNLVYRCLQNPTKQEVHNWLLRDQGALCCYTGIRITYEDSHIEHLKPQTICRREGQGEDIEGRNLLAAFPGEDKPNWPYGARKRGNWFGEDEHGRDASLFIHPLRPDCESRFRYFRDGSIQATADADSAAKATISKLGLDHGELCDRRKSVVQTTFFGKRSPTTKRDLEAFITRLDRRDHQGCFIQFCFVLKQVGKELMRLQDRERARRQAIARQARRTR